jgi:hypothetical protein
MWQRYYNSLTSASKRQGILQVHKKNCPHSTKHKSSFPVIEEASDSKDDDEERYDECPDVGDT